VKVLEDKHMIKTWQQSNFKRNAKNKKIET